MSGKPYYLPEDKIPLPPKDAEVFTTACDYCVVACGYKVYRWPLGREGGPKAGENALGADYPVPMMSGKWISPNQHNVITADGKPHHVVVVPDCDSQVVNVDGDHSVRGGTIAQKCFNPDKPTRDRLQYPMIRVNGKLERVSWELALDVMAEIGRYVIDRHGEDAWSLKMYSYQFFENTYALTKLALRDVGTVSFAVHDQPTGAGSDTPGLSDAGIEPFSASYEDWSLADTLLISGTDPFETKTIVFNEWMMKGVRERGTKIIFVLPRKTTGVAYAEKNGGLHLDLIPGTDTILQLAIARVIVENGWEDREFLARYVNNRLERDAETFQADGFEDYKRWILSYPYAEFDRAEEITGVSKDKIKLAAELLAKPRADGTRPKASFGLEKGNYWSNNYLNTASFASLGLICGAGNRPGQVISRLGGHQRGMMEGGHYPWYKVPEKFPGRQRKAVDLDRWVEQGRSRFVWVVGTTWLQSMTGSQELMRSVQKLTRGSPHQIARADKAHILDTLKKRVDSGGMVVANSEIYPVAPIGTELADIVLPAATWGEEDFTRCNGERRLRLYSKFYDAPGEAKPDWWIAGQVSRRMGHSGSEWKDSNEVFEDAAWWSRNNILSFIQLVEYARARGKRGHELLREYGTQGIQTPVRWEDGKLVGTKRLHDPKLRTGTPYGITQPSVRVLRFFGTPTGRANLIKTPWELFEDFYEAIKPRGEELWVTSGRINEIWQSGFDDQERRPYIRQRWPENWLEIHPRDAKVRGIESGDRVLIWNDAVPVQVGGFEAASDAARGIVAPEGDKSVQTDPLLLAVSGKTRSKGIDSGSRMSSAVQEDQLLAGMKREAPAPGAVPPAAGDALRLEDDRDEDRAIGLSWKDVQPLTYRELEKNGHIKFTPARIEAVAIVTAAVRPGVAFTYFLVPSSPANALAPRVLDPVSQRYRFKLGKGAVRKIGESPYKHTFAQMSFAPRTII